MALVAIAAIPYFDRSPLGVGILGTSAKGRKIAGFSALYAGTEPSNLYRSEDDGVTWTLVDTSTKTAPAQPIPPFSDDVLFYMRNTAPGGIWTKKVELRLDGVLVLDPDFAAQAIGTEDFTDAAGNDWSTVAGRGICATLE